MFLGYGFFHNPPQGPISWLCLPWNFLLKRRPVKYMILWARSAEFCGKLKGNLGPGYRALQVDQVGGVSSVRLPSFQAFHVCGPWFMFSLGQESWMWIGFSGPVWFSLFEVFLPHLKMDNSSS